MCYKHQWYSYSATSSVCYGISDMSHGHNSTVFRVLFPKISTGQKKRTDWSARSARFCNSDLVYLLVNITSGYKLALLKIAPDDWKACTAVCIEVVEIQNDFKYYHITKYTKAM